MDEQTQEIQQQESPLNQEQTSEVPERNVQTLLNEMVWKHGNFVHKRPDFESILDSYGLKRSDFNKAMYHLALKTYKQRCKELTDKGLAIEDAKRLLWMPEPEEERDRSGGKVYVWETKCGRYRIYRFMASPPSKQFAAQYRTPEASWDIFEHNKEESLSSPKFINSLEAALISVEKFHEKEYKTTILVSNRQEVLEEEARLFSKPKPTGATMTTQQPTTQQATTPTAGTGRGSKNPGLDAKILAVLNPTTPMSPINIKKAAGIPKEIGINSVLKRLGKERKVVVAYGAYLLDPFQVAASPTPTPEPEENGTEEASQEMVSEGSPVEPQEEKKEESSSEE